MNDLGPFSEKFEIVSHQYGSLSLKNHREMLDGGNGMTVLSIDLNQDEDEIIIEEELPGYTRFACGNTSYNFCITNIMLFLVINIYRTLVVQPVLCLDFQ